MKRQFLQRRFTRFLVESVVIVILITTASVASRSQSEASTLVRLFRLEGTFGEELPAKTGSDVRLDNSSFKLGGARLETEGGGFITRLRTQLTIANDDPRRITEVEWRLDVFDASLRSVSARVVQTAKLNIYPGETGVASARLGAVLPDRMIVLLQITRVAFVDGSAWIAPQECSLGEDLRTVSCKSK